MQLCYLSYTLCRLLQVLYLTYSNDPYVIVSNHAIGIDVTTRLKEICSDGGQAGCFVLNLNGNPTELAHKCQFTSHSECTPQSVKILYVMFSEL